MVAKKASSRKKVASKAGKTSIKKKSAAKRSGASKKRMTKKSSTKKVSRKKSAAKTAAARKSSKKTVTKKVSKKKAATKKPTKKKAAKKKVSQKKVASKKVSHKKKVSKKKASTKKAAKKAPASKKAAPKKAAPAKAAPTADRKPAAKKVKKPAVKIRPVAPPNPLEPTASGILIHGIAPYRPSPGEEYMSDAQLEHFKRILLAWKRELMEEVDRTVHHMQDEASNFPDPNDRATQESEFGLELRTRDRERKLLKKIESALGRIDDGSYGFCEETGEEIGLKRLEARPVATLCVEAQERRELAERQYRDRDDQYR